MALWDVFDGIYGPKWRARFQDEEAVKNWAREWSITLYDRCVTWRLAMKGVYMLRGQLSLDGWPPDLAEFISIVCDGPDPEDAFKEAQIQVGQMEFGLDKWSHPAIYWAAMDWGSTFDLRQASYRTSKSKWVKLLGNRLGQIGLPPVPKWMPPPVYKKGSDAARQQAMAKLAEKLGIRQAA